MAMGPIDELLCLGDSIYQAQFSNEVIALLKKMRAWVIQGNHEEAFLSEAGSHARARADVDQDLVAWLAEQPLRRMLTFGRTRLLMIHSTPWEPRGEYIYPHNPKLDRFAETDADFVLYGHTHSQVTRRVGRVLIVNPGTAGEGRDASDGRHLSCAVLDTNSGEVRVIDYKDPRFPPDP